MAEGVKEAAYREKGEAEQRLPMPAGSRPRPRRAHPRGGAVSPPLHLPPAGSAPASLPRPRSSPLFLPSPAGAERAGCGRCAGLPAGRRARPAVPALPQFLPHPARLLPAPLGRGCPITLWEGGGGTGLAHPGRERARRGGAAPHPLRRPWAARHELGASRHRAHRPPPPRYLCKVQPAAHPHTPFPIPTAQILPPRPSHTSTGFSGPPGRAPSARPLFWQGWRGQRCARCRWPALRQAAGCGERRARWREAPAGSHCRLVVCTPAPPSPHPSPSLKQHRQLL